MGCFPGSFRRRVTSYVSQLRPVTSYFDMRTYKDISHSMMDSMRVHCLWTESALSHGSTPFTLSPCSMYRQGMNEASRRQIMTSYTLDRSEYCFSQLLYQDVYEDCHKLATMMRS